MASKPSNVLNVTFCRNKKRISMGRLALINRNFVFEYMSDFLDTGLELSPFKLPLKPGVLVCEDRIFDGLFGLFNDSLPDGWGRLLLDRKLSSLGINPQALTPLDRLKYVGTRGMGALQYEPEMEIVPFQEKNIALDLFADECIRFQIDNEDQYIEDLLRMNGSSAGARPKILVSMDSGESQFGMSDNSLSHSHNDWIVKFRSSIDPMDQGPIEYAYHLMAQDAGLVVPEAKLFKSRKGHGFFGVKRFDRTSNSLIHMHTLSGLLHADHRIPSLDYMTVLKATCILTKNARECEKQFRNAVFNVLSHNRDDHAKNFSFLMDENGGWSVSPAYDLIFSSGPGGEHCTAVMGNGRNPTKKELLKLASVAEIPEKSALHIINEVAQATSKWKSFAEEAGVSKDSLNSIINFL